MSMNATKYLNKRSALIIRNAPISMVIIKNYKHAVLSLQVLNSYI